MPFLIVSWRKLGTQIKPKSLLSTLVPNLYFFFFYSHNFSAFISLNTALQNNVEKLNEIFEFEKDVIRYAILNFIKQW